MNTLIFCRSALCFFSIFIFFGMKNLSGQCPITVNAGMDQAVCAPSGNATLNGTITGNYLGYTWEPSANIPNPNTLTPNVNVTTTETFTLTGFAADPAAPNLVNNPAFELLNTGFTSAFTYTPTPITPGTYFLTTSPSIVINNFPPCDDHTFGNGTGYMMLVNGTGNAGANVWCQDIPVNPNSYYTMNAWTTVSPIAPPVLQFSVNGMLVGNPFNPGTGVCNWQNFEAAWFSGPATVATVCITDQNNSGNGLFGDDFALDDIFFGEACSVSDEVEVSLVSVDADLPLIAVLECNALPGGIVLDGSNSTTGPNINYQWTTSNGNIVSGTNISQATVNQQGSYTLTVTYNDGTTVCTDNATIEVLPDPNIVFASAFALSDLDCDNPTAIIDGGGSSSGPTISYSWSPALGIVSGQGTATPTVNMGGTYTLTVTNSISGCTDTEIVMINEDFEPPIAMGAAPALISCLDTLLTLDGTGSSTGSNFSYLWETSPIGGNIVSGATTLNDCVVDTAGIYSLTVTNTENGCTAIEFVSVGENTTPPVVMASVQDSIDCSNPSINLSGAGSSTGPNASYEWTGPGIVNGTTTLAPEVDEGGLYILTVTNDNSGCTASDSVTVLESTTPPVVDILPPDTLTCVVEMLELDATGSSQGNNFSFSWQTTGGNIVSGANTLTPTIDEAGSYTLTILDFVNGCSDMVSITVVEDTDTPLAEAGDPVTLDCDSSPEFLDGTGSTSGVGYSTTWTTNGGNILNGNTTLMPEVNAAGMYILTVENLQNGCTAIDSVSVQQDGNAPTATAIANDTLDCVTFDLIIDASGSSTGGNIDIAWTGPGIVSGGMTLMPTVDQPGTYTLTLTNQSNNCSASTSVVVVQDTVAPVVEIADPPTFDCLLTTDTLDASESSQGSNFSYTWDTANGNILGGGGTLQPVVEGWRRVQPHHHQRGHWLLNHFRRLHRRKYGRAECGCRHSTKPDLYQPDGHT